MKPGPPTFPLAQPLTDASFLELVPEVASAALPSFLPGRRWYGDKARTVSVATVMDSALARIGTERVALLIAMVAFADGSSVAYFVPLAATRSADPDVEPIAVFTGARESWFVVDAIELIGFQQGLLEAIAAEEARSGRHGRFVWRTAPPLAELLPRARSARPRLSTAQQSHSSVVYDEAIIVKLFRRLQPGINPEVELGRFLTTRTAFRHMPRLVADLTYEPERGEELSLGVAQSYVPNLGDGWTFVLGELEKPGLGDEGPARRLGEVTAELHLALAGAAWDSALAPERITAADIAAWSHALTAAVDGTASLLEVHRQAADAETRELIAAVLKLAPRLKGQAAGFERLIGCAKIRVHGDYHLGQTLRTPDGDFVILDFEGEPQRPIAERRAKTSPLKDVAGMLRSFSYARGATERARVSRRTVEPADRDLVAWERRWRAAFLDAYVSTSRAGRAAYLPTSDDDLRWAIAAWELDKALYEVNYELNNRPDWLRLPLAAILKFA